MGIRSWTLCLLAAALLAAGTPPGLAMPSVAGPTGIVSVPTAAVAPDYELQTAVTYRSLQMYDAEVGESDVTIWALQALRGVSDDAELWAAYQRVTNGKDGNAWELGGKYRLGREVLADAEVSVGASIGRWVDAFGMPAISPGITDIDTWKAYIVATRDLTPGRVPELEWEEPTGTRLIASLGLLYVRADPDVGDSQALTRPFAGLQISQKTLSVALEYRAKDRSLDEKAVFSATLRRPVGDFITVELGTTNAGPLGFGTEDQDIFIRLGYDVPMYPGAY